MLPKEDKYRLITFRERPFDVKGAVKWRTGNHFTQFGVFKSGL